jgi:phosphoribosyl-ATP pyrophosphohydrolase/phosphoribosyl-AMP cyclohydrolase
VLPAVTFLARLELEIESRKSSTAEKSYTKALLDGGPSRIGDKVREEAAEFAVAIESETDDRVANEAADIVYHVLVGLAQRGLSFREVLAVLSKRAGTSGHAEKASRANR